MTKLDRIKNGDDVAYEFFKFCMTLDLSSFHVGEPPRTEFFEEQRQHNECALKRFLLDVRSGEYPLTNFYGEQRTGEQTFTALELFNYLKKYVAETGSSTSIESVMSLGHCLNKNHTTLAPKVGGRVAKYRIRVAEASD